MRKLSTLLITGIFIAQLFPYPAWARKVDAPPTPTTSMSKFDRIEADGGFVVRDIKTLEALGYDPSRTWKAGDLATDVIQLGDLADIYPLQDLTHRQIFDSSGLSSNQVQLGSAPLLKKQTIGDWLKANPDKVNLSLSSSQALQQLVSGNWKGSVTSGWAIASEHSDEFKELLAEHPELANLPIESILNGDWKDTLGYAQKIALEKISEQLPEHLKGLPGKSLGVINDFKNGRIDRAVVGAVSIADALSKNPDVANLPFGALGDDTAISAIPGLADTPIKNLTGWEGSKVSDSPGLSESPLAAIPINNLIGILNGDIFGNLDVPLSGAEQRATNAITGGTRGGVLTPEACEAGKEKVKDCAHLELQDVDSNHTLGGKQFVSGKSQKVKGGKGVLKSVNGGWEPTGIQPWGNKAQLKLVLMDVAETDGKQEKTESGVMVSTGSGYGKFAMYAQFCIKKAFVDLGCSPHFIGPIPFLLHPKVSQNGKILIVSSSGPPEIPDEWRRRINQYEGQYGGNCEVGGSAPAEQELGESKYGYRPIAEANQADLVKVGTYGGYDQYLHKEAAAAWAAMEKAAASDGVSIQAGSAYRSKQLQSQLFASQTQEQGSPEKAAELSAPAGHSEHHSGYTLDVVDPTRPDTDIKHGFADTEAYRWLKENGAKYGFKQSYDGKHDGLTVVEEWHWAYTKTDSAKQALNLGGSHTADDGHSHDGDKAIASVRAPKTESEQFIAKSVALANKYKIDPVDLLTVMGFESAGTFRPDKFNSEGSGAVGLIQFMPKTAAGLGTSTYALTQMTRIEQLDYVDKYFADVGILPGDDLGTIYASILTGSRVGSRDLSDGSYTVNSAVRDMGPHREKAIALLKGAANLDTSGYNFAASGGPCIASAGGGPFVQGDGLGKGSFINPVNHPIDSPFGQDRGSHRHGGTDHFVQMGTPVKASDGGVIVDVETGCPEIGYPGSECGGLYGNFIYVRHPNGWVSRYAHLSRSLVKIGDKVSQGQVIGKSGSSGSSEGPHLHFEILDSSGRRQDPGRFIR